MTKKTREELADKEERKTITVWRVWQVDGEGNRKKRLVDNFRCKVSAVGNAKWLKKKWNLVEVEEVEMDFREYKEDLRRRMALARPDVEGVCEKCNTPFWKDERETDVSLCPKCGG